MQHLRPLLFLVLPAFGACIQTELIPEVLEPKLTLEQQSLTLTPGQTATLRATYTDEQLNDRSELVAWTSADPGIVAVTPQGVATGLVTGQAWATASAPGNLRDSMLITVAADNAAVATVEVLNAPATLTVGQTASLQARVRNASGAEISGKTIVWNSSAPGILSVSAGGVLAALDAGTAQITASADGVSSLPVAVQALPVGGLSRSGTFSGNAGYTVKGTATLRLVGNKLELDLGSDFMASNGPGLFVYLATMASGGLNSQNGRSLGALQSTSGMQSYSIPNGVDLNDYDYVVIYCMPFNVRFGTAQLKP